MHRLPLDLPEMLAREGFEVTMLGENPQPDPAKFEAILYLFAEETLLTWGHIFLDWAKVGGGFQRAMDRHWYDIPTAMISLRYLYYLYAAPRVPTYINADETMPTMQEAVLECLLGRAPWAGKPPHDPFCGLGDARYLRDKRGRFAPLGANAPHPQRIFSELGRQRPPVCVLTLQISTHGKQASRGRG
jgi:beta-N-acetylhexosaminidase